MCAPEHVCVGVCDWCCVSSVEYNDMKTELKDYLQRFAAEGKVRPPLILTLTALHQHSVQSHSGGGS